MGQKINPLGFRLGTTQNHHSFWFAQPKSFSMGLQEDEKIRDCIKNYVQKNMRIVLFGLTIVWKKLLNVFKYYMLITNLLF